MPIEQLKSAVMNLIVFQTRTTTRRLSTLRERCCQIKNYKFLFLASACSCMAALLGSSAIAAGPPPALNWIQLSPATSPPPRSYLSMTYDVVSGKVIMFGGFDGINYLNDTWTFDGVTWTKVSANHAPPARANAGMAYDVITQKVVLFGGYDGRSYLGDTWVWDGITSRWTKVRPRLSPTAVTGPMVFTSPSGSVDLLGGFDGRFYRTSMWQWNGTDWTQLFPTMLPYARSSAAVALDPI